MSDTLQEIRAQRLEKITQLRALGRDPYANQYRPTHWAADIHAQWESLDGPALEAERIPVIVAGRIVASRSFGKAGFIKLLDRTGQIQVYCQKQSMAEPEFQTFTLSDVGDVVWGTGFLFRTKTGELSIHAEQLRIVTKALRPLPEKWHGLTDVETRYRQRYVDMIANPAVRELFARRSRMLAAMRDFFTAHHFLEVETPMLHPIPGGATARPFVTHHNTLDMPLYLRIAPELYLKRLVVGGFERVFEINRNFRNEGTSTQHNPEFTMVEWYQAYATFEDLMPFLEQCIAATALATIGTTSVACQGTLLELGQPFTRYRMDDSICAVAGAPAAVATDLAAARAYAESQGVRHRQNNPSLGVVLNDLFEHLVQPRLQQPTYITHYPVDVSPLARRNAQDPTLTDRFELFILGREIANGFSELNDPVDQAARFDAQVHAKQAGDDEAMFFDADYIRALEIGMPPTAGAGLGVDRLMMILGDAPSIRDVILFPLLRPESPDDAPCA